MNPWIGWSLAVAFAVAAWQGYGMRGLAFAISAIAFWLLLTFNRVVRVMKRAAEQPVGHVDSAVMFNAGLSEGMSMLQIVTRTRTLGKRIEGTDDDWRWSDDDGSHVDLHFERGRLVRWKIERPT